MLRAAVGGGAAVCLGSLLGRVAARADDVAAPLIATALRDGLMLVSGAGGNVVVAGSPSGVAMVDSGAPEHARAVSSFVAERFAGAPVELLFNTHWHLDHSGGNDAVARAGTRIVAHENTRLWMRSEFFVDWQDTGYEPRPAAAWPTHTFRSSDRQPLSTEHAGVPIEYGLLREAHTDGDIYVRFPRHNVIAAGGAVTAGEYPVVDYITGGLIGGLIDATRELIALSDADTLIVPASGPAQTRGDLQLQCDMLETVRERMQTLARQGKSVREMLAAGITQEFDARWGNNAERFVTNAYKSQWGIGP